MAPSDMGIVGETREAWTWLPIATLESSSGTLSSLRAKKPPNSIEPCRGTCPANCMLIEQLHGDGVKVDWAVGSLISHLNLTAFSIIFHGTRMIQICTRTCAAGRTKQDCTPDRPRGPCLESDKRSSGKIAMPFARFSTGAASIGGFQARVVSSSNLFQCNGMTNKWTNKNNAIPEMEDSLLISL